MDILISSNLERLIYQTAGRDAQVNDALMKELSRKGRYTVTDQMRKEMAVFYGNYGSEKETADAIRTLYQETGYVMDTHTAVAESVYRKYVEETGDRTTTVIASTASPFKFARSVMTAIDPAWDSRTDFELIDELSKISGVKIPRAIEEIRTAPVLHDRVCRTEDMAAEVRRILRIDS